MHTFVGLSPFHAAPEVFRLFFREERDWRSAEGVLAGDVYAVGVIVFQLLTRTSVPWHTTERTLFKE